MNSLNCVLWALRLLMVNMTTLELYQRGILDICDSLVTDLIKFLKDEGRYKYRMISYMKKITNFFESLYDSQTDEDIETYERILYLMHKNINHDYRRLRIKKLSPADSVICIINKLFGYIPNAEEPKEIIKMFFDNIKNKGKLDKLLKTETSLEEAMSEGKIGKLRLQDIGLYYLEHPLPRSQEIKGESQEWEEVSGKEIEF